MPCVVRGKNPFDPCVIFEDMPEAIPKRLFLIDAMGFIFRAYFAPMDRLRNAQGMPTKVPYIFNNMLRKLLREWEPDYVAAVFDVTGRRSAGALVAKTTRRSRSAGPRRNLPLHRSAAGFRAGRMQRRGLLVDRAALAAMSALMEKEIAAHETEIYALAGQSFNINSSQQLGEILFDKLGLSAGRKTGKTKGRSTAADILQDLAAKHPLPKKFSNTAKCPSSSPLTSTRCPN